MSEHSYEEKTPVPVCSPVGQATRFISGVSVTTFKVFNTGQASIQLWKELDWCVCPSPISAIILCGSISRYPSFSPSKRYYLSNRLPDVGFASSCGAKLTNHVSPPQETLDLDVLLALLALTCLATSFTTQSHGLGCLGNRRRSTSSYLL